MTGESVGDPGSRDEVEDEDHVDQIFSFNVATVITRPACDSSSSLLHCNSRYDYGCETWPNQR